MSCLDGINGAFLKCLGTTDHLHVVLADFHIYSDEKIEILTLSLNKQKGDLTVYNLFGWFLILMTELSCLQDTLYIYGACAWRGDVVIWGDFNPHFFFFLFAAGWVLWELTIKRSLYYNMFVKDQHLWKRRGRSRTEQGRLNCSAGWMKPPLPQCPKWPTSMALLCSVTGYRLSQKLSNLWLVALCPWDRPKRGWPLDGVCWLHLLHWAVCPSLNGVHTTVEGKEWK